MKNRIATHEERVSVFKYLASKPNGIGTTSLVKSIFVLQEVFNVPLGYNFRIYTYGPYSAAIVTDADFACFNKQLVCEETDCGHFVRRVYSVPKDEQPQETGFTKKYKTEIDFVVTSFSNRNVSELELAATIIYVHNYYKREEEKVLTVNEVAKIVHDIKPHFTVEKISIEYNSLNKQGLIR